MIFFLWLVLIVEMKFYFKIDKKNKYITLSAYFNKLYFTTSFIFILTFSSEISRFCQVEKSQRSIKPYALLDVVGWQRRFLPETRRLVIKGILFLNSVGLITWVRFGKYLIFAVYRGKPIISGFDRKRVG